MHGSSDVKGRPEIVSMLAGAALGVATAWFLRPDPPACSTLENGLRACMPVLVVPPPLWLYVVMGLAGALAGLIVPAAVHDIRRDRRSVAP